MATPRRAMQGHKYNGNRNNKQSLRKAVARNLKMIREQTEPHMTQAKVADLFDPPLTRAAVAQWEIGETMPDLDRLAVLSKAFGVTIDSLIFGDDEVIQKDRRDISPEAMAVARMWQQLDAKVRAATVAIMRASLEKPKR